MAAKWLKYIGITALGVLLVATAWSTMTWSDSIHGAVQAHPGSNRGIALATSCERLGPLGRGGVGYNWLCQGTVDWSAGSYANKRTNAEFGLNELTPAEIGKPVDVWQATGKRQPIKRETERPYAWIGYATLIAPLALYAVFHTARQRRRDRAESEGR